jgi:undecaprenyl-diphosphatase
LNRLRQIAVPWLLSGLAVALLALAFFAWLAEEVIEGDTRAFDAGARAFAHSIASPQLTYVMQGLSFLGQGFSLAALAALAAILFVRTGRRRAAWLLIITMLGAGALDQMLKLLFHRPRPDPFFNTPRPSTYSFPSGHALASCCFFGVMAAMLAARAPRRAARIALWATAALLAAAIGFSRIYLGVHYPSDVVAGYAAAVVWVFTVKAVQTRRV